jgi:hypothetical protein
MHDAATPAPIADPASLGVLASNLKTVWDAPTTDARLKKRIVRTLVHEIVADIDEAASEIVLIVHWVGGAHSELRLPKRRRGQRDSTSADVIQAVRQPVLITSDDLIAGLLNRNDLKKNFPQRQGKPAPLKALLASAAYAANETSHKRGSPNGNSATNTLDVERNGGHPGHGCRWRRSNSCLAAGSEFDFNARRDATTP